jgi:predicted RNA-binding Zn-ribbon protein involved in translation (DUF1610 family)
MVLYARRPIEPDPEPAPVLDAEVIDPPDPDFIVPNEHEAAEAMSSPISLEQSPDDTNFHCPFCGRELQEDFSYCPDCGRDSSQVHLCGNCGQEQFLPPEIEKVFCLNCGELLQ